MLVMAFVFTMVILVRKQVDKVLLSMTIIYIVSIQFVIADMFFNAGLVHSAMKNYESVRYLINEPTHEVDPKLPIKNWMKKGEIEFENYTSSGYGVPLHNLCFKIRPGEKIIIIGRPGAGKSSIVSAIS
jgi:ABC-type multidrug transport system fused ATPase/permease subunit